MRKTRKPAGSLFIRGLWLDVGDADGDYCALVMQVIAPGVAMPLACYVDHNPRVARRLARVHINRHRDMVFHASWLVDAQA